VSAQPGSLTSSLFRNRQNAPTVRAGLAIPARRPRTTGEFSHAPATHRPVTAVTERMSGYIPAHRYPRSAFHRPPRDTDRGSGCNDRSKDQPVKDQPAVRRWWVSGRSSSARISHQASAATAPWHALSGFRSLVLLNVVSATPARPSVAKPSHRAPLNRLATNPGEKCGLGPSGRRWRYEAEYPGLILNSPLAILRLNGSANSGRRRVEEIQRCA
jgi:hypothetical protein